MSNIFFETAVNNVLYHNITKFIALLEDDEQRKCCNFLKEFLANISSPVGYLNGIVYNTDHTL